MLQLCSECLSLKASNGKGAVKINGGGFAGSVIAVVPETVLTKVMDKMKKKYGEENVQEIFVREDGPKTLYNFMKK